MTIRLKIDNLDTLPDGGPVQFVGEARSFVIGRSETLDWTLPDPSRFISGKHCEIRFEQGGYWLFDVSTNGTFLNGARQRMKNPHRLADGDRIAIGHYIINVALAQAADRAPDPFDEPRPSAMSALPEDIWGSPVPPPAPIDRRDLMPAQWRGQRQADFSQEFLALPEVRPAMPPVWESPAPPMPPEPSLAFAEPAPPPAAPAVGVVPAAGSTGGAGAPGRDPFGGAAFAVPSRPESFSPVPPGAGSVRGGEAAAPAPGLSMATPASSTGASAFRRSATGEDWIERFARGAGLEPAALAGRDPGEMAETLGRILRVVVEDVQQLLKARSAAKVLAKSSKRTMLGRMNNPLKFLATAEEVVEVVMTGRRAGYLPGPDAFIEAFRDLKRHEFATYAAMQTALSRLLADLSPESIEGRTTGSPFTSRKARNWEMYVARWDAKTEPHENGMLDVFLAYFAEAYDEDGQDAQS